MPEESEAIELKTILIAVDGSEHSNKAVRYACTIGTAMGAEILLLHVVPMLVSATPYHDTVSDQPFLALQKVGEDILARASNVVSSLNCKVTELLSHGDPSNQIISIAEERGVNLIIIGSRGLSGWKRMFVGSISDKVASHASCPVMIVR